MEKFMSPNPSRKVSGSIRAKIAIFVRRAVMTDAGSVLLATTARIKPKPKN
jgi:hypothetical protein